jgi:hypothetical protein
MAGIHRLDELLVRAICWPRRGGIARRGRPSAPLFVSNPRWCCAIPASASRVEPIEVSALDRTRDSSRPSMRGGPLRCTLMIAVDGPANGSSATLRGAEGIGAPWHAGGQNTRRARRGGPEFTSQIRLAADAAGRGQRLRQMGVADGARTAAAIRPAAGNLVPLVLKSTWCLGYSSPN